MNYFKFSEFTKESVIPLYVAQAILDYHMPALNLLRNSLGEPITISERSGYRSVAHEKLKGRSGNSQHCFQNGMGAVDLTTRNMEKLGVLLTISAYSRVCWYPTKNFYHCDFKHGVRSHHEHELELFVDYDDGTGWQRVNSFRQH